MKKLFTMLTVMALLISAAGCTSGAVSVTPFPVDSAAGVILSPAPEATPMSTVVLSMSVTLDPDLHMRGDPDPYAHCNKDILGAFEPDPALFNALYRAVEERETTVDISDFDLPLQEKSRTANSIYALSNCQFFFLKKVKVSEDEKTVSISYRQTDESMEADINSYYGLMSFVLNDIALKEYSSVQKFFAIYNYIITNSVYSSDLNDETTMGAFSVLVRHEGICYGYASLGELLFNAAKIPSRYVSNEAHAWDVVTLDGQNFNTDLTWGAGISGSNKCIAYALMDDNLRLQSLAMNGNTGTDIYAGYPYNPEAVPVSTDARYGVLSDLTFSPFALDIPGGWLYYCREGAVKRMKLDGGAEEDVLSMIPGYLAFFNGLLYYVDMDAKLHSLDPDSPNPVPADIDTPPINYMELNGSQIACIFADPANPNGSLNLIPFQAGDYENAETVAYPASFVPAGRSFCLQADFSVPMAAWIGEDSLRLTDENGNALPVHAQWSADGKSLFLRPQVYWGDISSLRLYVKGLSGESGTAMADIARMEVNFGE